MKVVTSLNREKLGEIIRSSVRTEELMRGGCAAEAPSEGDQLSQCKCIPNMIGMDEHSCSKFPPPFLPGANLIRLAFRYPPPSAACRNQSLPLISKVPRPGE